MTAHILLIEDDPRLARMVEDYLREAGFSVMHAASGRSGVEMAQRESFDAIILDLMLPDIDGLEVCRQVRARARTPILMLTARGDALDRIIGLELGADDYLPKPFEPRELVARLRAVLRRSQAAPAANILRFGRLEVDKDAREVRVDGMHRVLTSYQYEVVLAMAERAGRVLSREALFDIVKGESIEAFDRSIDVHISRIRSAIEDNPKRPRRVLTVRGAGYVFAKAQD